MRWLTVILAVIACASGAHAQGAYSSEHHPFRLTPVAQNLEHPWGIAFLPDGVILVTERPGRLRLIQEGRLQAEPVRGLPPVAATGQGGLLDVALHPQFATNALLYLCHSAEVPGGNTTRITRARLAGGGLADARTIFEMQAPDRGGHHFGCRVGFGSDGMLYATLGERNERNRAQDLGDHGGKIIRLHEDGRIPADNPFVGRPGARAEIYSWGHRNPQGMARHPITGQLWISEHGPLGGDEVNVIQRGGNFGWPVVTHGREYWGGTISSERSRPGLVDTVHVWPRTVAPAGMAFYTGTEFPRWQGSLFVGGLLDRAVMRLELAGERVVREERLLADFRQRIRHVAQSPDGRLHILTDASSGGVYRLGPS